MTPLTFRAEQFVPQSLDKVFEFFSKAENLQKLTPALLNFRILSVEPGSGAQGNADQVFVALVFPIRWTTEIIEWEPPHHFVDVQRKGPYKRWHHEHRFAAQGNGTRITDEVQYLLPFGVFGAIAHRLKVKKDVETIFACRTEVVRRLFAETG